VEIVFKKIRKLEVNFFDEGDQSHIRQLFFFDNDTKFAVLFYYQAITIWDYSSLKILRRLRPMEQTIQDTDSIRAMLVLKTGKIITSHNKGVLLIRNVYTGICEGSLVTQDPENSASWRVLAEISPNIVAGTNGDTIEIWDVSKNNEKRHVHIISGEPGESCSDIFSLKNNYMACIFPNAVKVYETKKWKVVRNLVHTPSIPQIYCPFNNGNSVMCVRSGSLVDWEWEKGVYSEASWDDAKEAPLYVKAVGRLMVMSVMTSSEKYIQVRDLNSGDCVQKIKEKTCGFYNFVVSGDCKVIVGAGNNSYVYFYGWGC